MTTRRTFMQWAGALLALPWVGKAKPKEERVRMVSVTTHDLEGPKTFIDTYYYDANDVPVWKDTIVRYDDPKVPDRRFDNMGFFERTPS